MITEPWLQVRHGRLDGPERRIDVGLHRPVEVLRRDVHDRGVGLLSTGVVDQDVEAAQFAHRAVDHFAAELLGPKVARNADADAALGLDQLDDLLGVRLLERQVGDGHVGAFPGIGDGRGAAHAGIAPGDQGFAAEQAAGTFVAGLAVVGAGRHVPGESGLRLLLTLEGRLGILGGGILERCRRRRAAKAAFFHIHGRTPVASRSGMNDGAVYWFPDCTRAAERATKARTWGSHGASGGALLMRTDQSSIAPLWSPA